MLSEFLVYVPEPCDSISILVHGTVEDAVEPMRRLESMREYRATRFRADLEYACGADSTSPIFNFARTFGWAKPLFQNTIPHPFKESVTWKSGRDGEYDGFVYSLHPKAFRDFTASVAKSRTFSVLTLRRTAYEKWPKGVLGFRIGFFLGTTVIHGPRGRILQRTAKLQDIWRKARGSPYVVHTRLHGLDTTDLDAHFPSVRQAVANSHLYIRAHPERGMTDAQRMLEAGNDPSSTEGERALRQFRVATSDIWFLVPKRWILRRASQHQVLRFHGTAKYLLIESGRGAERFHAFQWIHGDSRELEHLRYLGDSTQCEVDCILQSAWVRPVHQFPLLIGSGGLALAAFNTADRFWPVWIALIVGFLAFAGVWTGWALLNRVSERYARANSD